MEPRKCPQTAVNVSADVSKAQGWEGERTQGQECVRTLAERAQG